MKGPAFRATSLVRKQSGLLSGAAVCGGCVLDEQDSGGVALRRRRLSEWEVGRIVTAIDEGGGV